MATARSTTVKGYQQMYKPLKAPEYEKVLNGAYKKLTDLMAAANPLKGEDTVLVEGALLTALRTLASWGDTGNG